MQRSRWQHCIVSPLYVAFKKKTIHSDGFSFWNDVFPSGTWCACGVMHPLDVMHAMRVNRNTSHHCEQSEQHHYTARCNITCPSGQTSLLYLFGHRKVGYVRTNLRKELQIPLARDEIASRRNIQGSALICLEKCDTINSPKIKNLTR